MTSTTPASTAGSTRVLLAIAVTVLAWASAFIVIRGVGPYLSGGPLALGRLLIGAAALSLMLFGAKWVRPKPREWMLIVLYGVAWFAIYNVTLNIAEQTLDAGTAAMIVNIGPILIALGAGIFLGEGIPRWLAIGAGTAFGGVVLIGIGSSSAPGVDSAGIWWSLIAALSYAIGVISQKRVLRRIPSTQVTWMGCVIGAILCLPFAGTLVDELSVAPIGAVVGMVYLGVVPTALAFTTWGYALSHMPAGQLGVTTYVVPAIVVLLSFAVFGEIPTVLAIIGGIVCLVGVALSRRRQNTRSQNGDVRPVPVRPQNLSQ